ncbi:MAG: hypothetical protein A2Y10_02725 [Planctomycetes bacterium GWF2_41_51]|nr:MAG: hypothetical protein A2Y10_02725 [Planctomycetes bacterium GWF2_41_51]HBG27464.1 hypothetical protein [Phycisphaerales bacterium]
MQCTIKKYLKIVQGSLDDYKLLSRFHYRSCQTGPTATIYKIIDCHPSRELIEPVVGIIIYSMPAVSVQLRNVATQGLFTKSGSSSANLQLINQNIRTISRVVIEPRYRALGLAYQLVKKTMPLLNMPYIEALAVMGKVNPFFEKAGMMKYEAHEPLRSVKLRQALSSVGIEEYELVDIELTNRKIENLNTKAKAFIEKHITDFLSAYGRRAKCLPQCLKRTEFFISRLSERPVYYIWRNAQLNLKFKA